MAKLEELFNSVKGKRLAFFGIGVTNAPSALLFAKKGAIVTACDKNSREYIGEGICSELETAGVQLCLGENYLENTDYDIIFRTPGMNISHPVFALARANGAVITSEMEMFFKWCPCKKIAVTGSDGKTTTTTLIAKMLQQEGHTVHLGGNIGKALLPMIEQIKPTDFAVVELSSFQLITMQPLSDVAVITNVQPNHLDWHTDFDEYINAKINLVTYQNKQSKTVLNLDNKHTKAMASLVNGETLWFSRQSEVENGAYAKNGEIFFAKNGEKTKLMNRSDIKLPGDHNVENYLAAIAATHGLVSASTTISVARSFNGVEHRMELVRTVGGVLWYNDSIATNPTRTMAGLRSHTQKVILIAGGYDKKIPFDPMADDVVKKTKHLILMGATAKSIEQVVKNSSLYNPAELPISHVESMEAAVELAQQIAHSGDIVVLSPASASFDLYKNFEIRGNHFKTIVEGLK